MDRAGGAGVISFIAPVAAPGSECVLGPDAAHHATVRRAKVGDAASITDGAGRLGTGRIVALSRTSLTAWLDAVQEIAAPPAVHLFVPVADRDRMLWLAEKCAELQATSWTPVKYRRSSSVSPRGEGEAFAEKVRVRMAAAVEQSQGAWLPEIRPMVNPADIRPTGVSVVLERGGEGVHPRVLRTAPVTLAIGPEGGFEPEELSVLQQAGFKTMSLGGTTLRFETAAIAALAIVRATLNTDSGG